MPYNLTPWPRHGYSIGGTSSLLAPGRRSVPCPIRLVPVNCPVSGYRFWLVLVALGLGSSMAVAQDAAKPAAKDEPRRPKPHLAKPPPRPPAWKHSPRTRPKPPAKAYLEMPVDDSLKQSRIAVGLIIRKDNFGPGEEQQVDNYFRKFAVPSVDETPRTVRACRVRASRCAVNSPPPRARRYLPSSTPWSWRS